MTSGAMVIIMGISNLMQGNTFPIEYQQSESTFIQSEVGINLAQGNGARLNPLLERNSFQLNFVEKHYEAKLWLAAANLMEDRVNPVELPQPMRSEESISYESLSKCQHLQASLSVELESKSLDDLESGIDLRSARSYIEDLIKRSHFWGLSYAGLEAGLFNALRSNTSIPKISIKKSEYWHVATNDSCNIKIDVKLIYLDDLHVYALVEGQLGYPYILYSDESWHRVTEPGAATNWIWLGSIMFRGRMSHPNIDKQLAFHIEKLIREKRCKDQDEKVRIYPCLPHR